MRARLPCLRVSLSGCANRSQGSRGVRAGPQGFPPQGAGAGARARDASAFALRTAVGGPQDQKPPRPSPPHEGGEAPAGAGRQVPPSGASRHLPTPSARVGPLIIRLFGDYCGGETPVPIPNTVVKPSSADGTVGVTRWESRSLPSIL